MRTRKLIAATMAAALTVTAISAYTVSGIPALMSAYATDAENTVTVDGLNSIPDENGDTGGTRDAYGNMEKLGDVELEVGESTTVTIPGTDHYTCVVIFGSGDEYGYDMEGKFIELKEISRKDGNTTYEIIPKKPCRGDVCFSPSEDGWDPIACLSVHTPGSDSIDVDLGELGVTGGTQGTGDTGETQEAYGNMEKLGDVELEVGKSTTVTIPGTDHYTCVVIFGSGDDYTYDMDGSYIELKEISREDGNTTYEIIPKKPCRGDVCFSPSEDGWDPIACLSVHTPGSDSIDVDLGELGVAGGTQGTGDTGETQEAYENMEKLGDVELEVGKSTTVTIPGTDHYTCVVIFGSGDEYGYDMEGKFIELKEISRKDGNTTYEIIPKKPCRGDVCFSPSEDGWDPIACLSVHTPGSDSIDVDLGELGVAGETQDTDEPEDTKKTPENAVSVSDDEIAVDMSGTESEDRTGILPMASEVQDSEDGKVAIVTEDAEGNEPDSYTETSAAATVEIPSGENAVNLPQTGNNSLKNLLLAVGAFMLTCLGFVAVMKSGVIRRRRDEQ